MRQSDKDIMERAQEAMRQVIAAMAEFDTGAHTNMLREAWDARRLLLGVIDRVEAMPALRVVKAAG